MRCPYALTLAACGDDGRSGADAGPPAPDGGDGSATDRSTAFAVATDFVATGIASTIAIPSLDVSPNAVDGVASTDPVVRHQDGRLYVINRFGQDNVTVLEAATLQLIGQVSTGVSMPSWIGQCRRIRKSVTQVPRRCAATSKGSTVPHQRVAKRPRRRAVAGWLADFF